MHHTVRMAGIIPAISPYCLISQAKDAANSVWSCLICNSHNESRTIQVNNRIVRHITIKLYNIDFCGILRLLCWFSTSKRLPLWCLCIEAASFWFRVRWGFSLFAFRWIPETNSLKHPPIFYLKISTDLFWCIPKIFLTYQWNNIKYRPGNY